MPSQYNIRQYKTSDKDGVFALVEEIWGASVKNNLKQQWDWKYCRKQQHQQQNNQESIQEGCQEDKNDSRVYVMTYGSKIIGIFGVMSEKMKGFDHELFPIFGTDFGIHPDYRGAGIRLLKFIMNGDKTVIGIPNERAHLFEKKLGFMDASRFDDYLAIINLKDYLTVRGHKPFVATLVGRFYNIISPLLFAAFKIRFRKSLTWATINQVDERFDVFWDEVAVSYNDVMTIRDQSFLEWRCNQIPNQQYAIFTAQSHQKIKGYIVLIIKDVDSIKQGTIVDFLVAKHDTQTLSFLLQNAMQEFAKNKAVIVNTSITQDQAWCDFALKKSGFLVKTLGAYVDIYDTDKTTQKSLAEKSWYMTLIDADTETTK